MPKNAIRSLVLSSLICTICANTARAATWTASETNVQNGWVWWFSGKSHWTDNPNNAITIQGITDIQAVNYYEPCPETSYTLNGESVQFSGLPSKCAVQSIIYNRNTQTGKKKSSAQKPVKSVNKVKWQPAHKPKQTKALGKYKYNGDSRIKIKDTHKTDLDIGRGDFAIRFKIKTGISDLSGSCNIDNINNGNMIFDRDRLHQDGSSIEVSILNGAIAARFDNIAICGNIRITDGLTHIVKVERSGNKAIISIDGKIDRSIRVNPADIRCRKPNIPGDCDIALYHEKWQFESAHHFYGDITELEIFNNGKKVY